MGSKQGLGDVIMTWNFGATGLVSCLELFFFGVGLVCWCCGALAEMNCIGLDSSVWILQ